MITPGSPTKQDCRSRYVYIRSRNSCNTTACSGGVDLCSYAALRGVTWEGEPEREGDVHSGGEESSWLVPIVCPPPPLGPLYVGGRGQPCPSTKAAKGWSRWGQGPTASPRAPLTNPQTLGRPTRPYPIRGAPRALMGFPSKGLH
jgi:hypothetical protein